MGHEMLCRTVTTGAKGIVSKSLKNIWTQYQDNIQQILYKKLPY
jgi:hypothetical protein